VGDVHHRDGVPLHFSVEGRGDGRVLLMHTGGGGDGNMWNLAGYVEGLPGTSVSCLTIAGMVAAARPRWASMQ
jgi:pimeloyl-ACP methyl ester carboxylesterase